MKPVFTALISALPLLSALPAEALRPAPATEVPAGMARLILAADDPVGDSVTGFQWLLDSSHSSYGDIFYPDDFAFFGDYAPFDYALPEGADKPGTIRIISGEAALDIPAGTYDWMVAMTDGTGTRFPLGTYVTADDFTFAEGCTYRLTVTARDGESPCVDLLLPTDVALSSLLLPSSGTSLTASEPVKAVITNQGTAEATGIRLSYSVNGSTPVAETFSGTLLPGESAPFAFSIPADFSKPGKYEVKCMIDMPGDMLPANNTLSAECRHLVAVAAPYEMQFSSLDAESFAEEWMVINTSPLDCGWSYNEYVVGMDGLPGVASCQTASYQSADDWLISPPLLFATGKAHVVFSSAAGNVENPGRLEVCVGRSPSPSSMLPLAVLDVASEQWVSRGVNFDTDGSTPLYIAFHGISDSSGGSIFIGSVAADNGEFVGVPAVSLARNILPVSNCDLSSDTRIGIEVSNNGTGPLTAYTLSGAVNGESFSTSFTEPILPGETRALLVDRSFDFSTPGDYAVSFHLQGNSTDIETSAKVTCYEPFTALPVTTQFSLGINSGLWEQLAPDTWHYEPLFHDFFTTAHGPENGLLSHGLALRNPVKVRMSFRGSDWSGTALGVYIGLASENPAEYVKVYSLPEVTMEDTEVEFTAPIPASGNYSLLIADEGQDISYLKLNYVAISEASPYDLAITETSTDLAPYSPASATVGNRTFLLTVRNNGFMPQENVTLRALVDGEEVARSEGFSLAPDEIRSVPFEVSLPERNPGDSLLISFELSGAEGEASPEDNVAALPDITLTEYTYACEDLDNPRLSTGFSQPGIALGNIYTLHETSDLTSLTVGFTSTEDAATCGSRVKFAIWEVDADRHLGRLLWSQTCERGEGGLLDIDIPDMRLAPGSYLFEVEQTESVGMALGYDPRHRTPVWQRESTNLYPVDGFPLCIRALFEPAAVVYAKDVAVKEISVPQYEEAHFSRWSAVKASVRNCGYEPARGVLLLDVDGTEIARREFSLLPYEEMEAAFDDVDLSAVGPHAILLSASCADEENPANNSLVKDIRTIEGADPYTMDFESCFDFDAAGDPWNPGWRTIDRNAVPTNYYWAYDHPHRGEPCGFMAFNPAATVPAMTSTGFDAMTPRSGERFGLAFNFDNYAPEAAGISQSDVWIISPKLRLGENSSFEFYVKGIPSTFTSTPEPYRVLVSDTGDDSTDFIVIGEDDRKAPLSDWERVEADLSRFDGKEVYVAIQYLGRPVENTCLLIDDLRVTTDIPNAITPVAEESPVRIDGNSIIAPQGSRIFTADGIPTGSSNLPSGIYLLKTPAKTVKVRIP